MAFTLHPRLAKGTHFIGKSGSCHVLLKDNAAFPWILIVPETEEEIVELHQLPADQFAEVVFLIRQVSQFMSDTFQPEKINVACLGNVVRQMHLHVVARWSHDPAWPDPIWTCGIKKAYQDEDVIDLCVRARLALNLADEP
jgi:diadenosine tetraphosphate (Ap4A) HIT family hydrolase